MKSEYIASANLAYSNLKESEELFRQEAYILSYVKCSLLRKEELNDFYTNGINVSTYKTGNGYALYFDNYCINIDVFENMIVDFEIKNF